MGEEAQISLLQSLECNTVYLDTASLLVPEASLLASEVKQYSSTYFSKGVCGAAVHEEHRQVSFCS